MHTCRCAHLQHSTDGGKNENTRNLEQERRDRQNNPRYAPVRRRGTCNGHTAALIDLDPQSSAAKWRDNRDGDTPAVISTHSERLSQILQLAEENGATFAILDTAPHTETAALDAARVADMALVPCKPALIDLQAIGSTIDVVHLAKVPAHIVLNAVPSRGDLAEQARQAIEIYDIPCAPCEVGHRIGFVHAYNAGLTVQEFEPSSKATNEINALYAYIANEMGV